MDWRIPTILVAFFVVLMHVLLRAKSRRRRSEEPVSTAAERAKKIAVTALDAFRAAQSEDPNLPKEELLVRVFMAASGEPESQARKRIAQAMSLSSSMAASSSSSWALPYGGSGSWPMRSNTAS